MNSKEVLYKIKLLKFAFKQHENYTNAMNNRILDEIKELQIKLDFILNFINTNSAS